MTRFTGFSRLPLIHFSEGKVKDLHSLARGYGRNIVLVTGQNSLSGSETGRKLLDELHSAGFNMVRVVIKTEPSSRIIDESVKKCTGIKADVVVSVGGGSVIDAGKAISAMIPLASPVEGYLEGVGTSSHPGNKIPFIAVPTTAGTGSEATRNAVISDVGPGGYKKSLRHDNFVPDVALVDPRLTLSCSKHLTSASGMDCFTQLTEAFLSPASNEYTDALALEGLKAVKDSLVRCYNDGTDTGARSGMSFAALTSGICLANAGLGVVHGFASSIGARHEIPHGIICGTLMGVANEVNVRKLRDMPGGSPALKKYAGLGKLFLDREGKPEDYYIDGFIDFVKQLTGSLNIPGLRKYINGKTDLNAILESTECKNNPVRLGPDELMEILEARMVL
jgi:alcohol dehydrogenase class IV